LLSTGKISVTQLKSKLVFSEFTRLHQRTDFNSGIVSLDNYLRQQASQDLKRYLAATYVLADENSVVCGYYTLSAFSVYVDEFPDEITRKLPRYPMVPCILIGRLAVDKQFHGGGLGRSLLVHALNNCYRLSAEVGVAAVVVDAINDSAKSFYQRYGFSEFVNYPDKLFLPMQTIKRLCVDAVEDVLEMTNV